MERVNKIFLHPLYQESLAEIDCLEQDRVFCGHGLVHVLDVARLAYILCLEEGLEIGRETVYAAALLHDIGRHLQYTQGIPHHQASAKIACQILPQCGFSREEQDTILEAISSHRNPENSSDWCRAFYRADKLSRSCYSCQSQSACDWPKEKKNLKITY